MTINLTDPIFTDEDKAREHLESIRWPDGPYCPHCGEASPQCGQYGPSGQRMDSRCSRALSSSVKIGSVRLMVIALFLRHDQRTSTCANLCQVHNCQNCSFWKSLCDR